MTRKQNFRDLCNLTVDGLLYNSMTVQRAKHQEAALHQFMAHLGKLNYIPSGGTIRVELVAGQVEAVNPCSGHRERWNGDFWLYDRMGEGVTS